MGTQIKCTVSLFGRRTNSMVLNTKDNKHRFLLGLTKLKEDFVYVCFHLTPTKIINYRKIFLYCLVYLKSVFLLMNRRNISFTNKIKYTFIKNHV